MQFQVVSGSDLGQVFSADVSAATIGRGSGNLVALSDPKVSRQHARIEVVGGQGVVEDLGSTNGTYVNEQRLAARGRRALKPGDQVRVGDTTLRFDGLVAAAAGDPWLAQDASPASARPRWLIPAIAVLALLLLAAGLGWLLTRDTAGEVSTRDATRTAEAPVILVTPDTPTPVTYHTVAAETTPQPIDQVQAAPAAQPTAGQPEAPAPASPDSAAGAALGGQMPSGQMPGADAAGAAGALLPGGQMPGGAAAGAAGGLLPGGAGLEQLPAVAGQMFPGVPAEQLPQAMALAAQGGQLAPTDAQALIGGLFPGVPAAQLPAVIQSNFPGVPPDQLQAVLDLVFPGQGVAVPNASPLSGRIFYGARSDDGRLAIYQINADGSGQQLVLEDASEVAVSPDRQWLAYYSWRDDARGLRLRNIASGEERSLTADAEHSYPSWAPDQQRLVFYDYSDNTVQTIAVDGSDRRQIASGEFPAWSPRGDRIAYKGCIGNDCGIILVAPDGSDPRRLTTNANDGQPAWSPDGNALTFVSNRDGNWEIYAINADGSWLRRITDNPTTDGLPEWSADGLRIAFRSDRGGVWAIWVASGVSGPATKLVDAETGTRWQWEKISWR
jgi:hypothetical protein